MDENMRVVGWVGIEFIIGGRDVKLLRLIISLFGGGWELKRSFWSERNINFNKWAII